MDPNTARSTVVERANTTLAISGSDDLVDLHTLRAVAIELAEAVHDLDGWLRMGGFFPDAWTSVYRENTGRKRDVDV